MKITHPSHSTSSPSPSKRSTVSNALLLDCWIIGCGLSSEKLHKNDVSWKNVTKT